MNTNQNSISSMANANEFDVLRAQFEVQLAQPAIIAITSSTTEDGKESVAAGLSQSLASSGYRVLFLDASPIVGSTARLFSGSTFEEVAQQIEPVHGDSVCKLAFGDSHLQKKTSQRDIQASFAVFRGKFDYIVICTEHGLSGSFATSLLVAADAVVVTVRVGRRQSSSDRRLSEFLDRLGDRFMGVLSVERPISAMSKTKSNVAEDLRRGRSVHGDATVDPTRDRPAIRV